MAAQIPIVHTVHTSDDYDDSIDTYRMVVKFAPPPDCGTHPSTVAPDRQRGKIPHTAIHVLRGSRL